MYLVVQFDYNSHSDCNSESRSSLCISEEHLLPVLSSYKGSNHGLELGDYQLDFALKHKS